MKRVQWLSSAAAALSTATWLGAVPAKGQSRQTLRIGAGGIESHAEGYYALENGFFRRHGLDVEVRPMRNGSAIAAAVAAGDLQIGVSSILQLTQARSKNFPFIIITPGAVHDGRVVHTTNLVVAPDSKIASAKDLNGKVVAVSTLNGLDQLISQALIDKSGGDSSTVKFIEISPAAATEALLQGRVDAAQLEEPELSAAASRVRRLGDGEDSIAPRFVTTGWFTTNEWLANNRDAARQFSAAIFEAGTWAMQNPERAGTVLQKALRLTQARATQIFATKRDARELEPLIAAAVKYKLAGSISAADLVWNGSR
jgi:NitT/TauT family transport system substrate-binding protein